MLAGQHVALQVGEKAVPPYRHPAVPPTSGCMSNKKALSCHPAPPPPPPARLLQLAVEGFHWETEPDEEHYADNFDVRKASGGRAGAPCQFRSLPCSGLSKG